MNEATRIELKKKLDELRESTNALKEALHKRFGIPIGGSTAIAPKPAGTDDREGATDLIKQIHRQGSQAFPGLPAFPGPEAQRSSAGESEILKQVKGIHRAKRIPARNLLTY